MKIERGASVRSSHQRRRLDHHPAREMPGSLRANQEAELEGDTRVFRPSRESLSPKSPAACRVTRVVARPFRVCASWADACVHGVASSHGTCHLPLGFAWWRRSIMTFLERGVACIRSHSELKSVYLKKKGYPYARSADFVFS